MCDTVPQEVTYTAGIPKEYKQANQQLLNALVAGMAKGATPYGGVLSAPRNQLTSQAAGIMSHLMGNASAGVPGSPGSSPGGQINSGGGRGDIPNPPPGTVPMSPPGQIGGGGGRGDIPSPPPGSGYSPITPGTPMDPWIGNGGGWSNRPGGALYPSSLGIPTGWGGGAMFGRGGVGGTPGYSSIASLLSILRGRG